MHFKIIHEVKWCYRWAVMTVYDYTAKLTTELTIDTLTGVQIHYKSQRWPHGAR